MTEEHYILILQKKLAGEITLEEAKSLDKWLSESPENQRIADSVQSIWAGSESFSQEVELDLDSDFSMIEKKLGETGKKEAIVRTMPPRRRWLRIAAALLVLAATPFVIKNFMASSPDYSTIATGSDASQKAIELPDGSRVWLNANSKIGHFTEVGGKERRVKLTGEAFFEVAKDAARPFVVETTAGKVTVLGTSFSVKNVDSEDDFMVHVATGRVQMQPDGTSDKLILTKNESGIFQKKAARLWKEKNDNLNELAWHTRSLFFQDEPLSKALVRIGELYGVDIISENDQLVNCPLSARFKNKEFASVKMTLETMLGAEIVETGKGKYALRGGRCE